MLFRLFMMLCQATGIKLKHDTLKNLFVRNTEFSIKIDNLILVSNFVFFEAIFESEDPN